MKDKSKRYEGSNTMQKSYVGSISQKHLCKNNCLSCSWLNLCLMSFPTMLHQWWMPWLFNYFSLIWNFHQLCLLCQLPMSVMYVIFLHHILFIAFFDKIYVIIDVVFLKTVYKFLSARRWFCESKSQKNWCIEL